MMTGRVTARREATLRLTVLGPDQRQHVADTVLDTGFNGFLTLPSHMVQTLRLPFVGHRRATLGDGSIVVLDLYLATVLWYEQEREVLLGLSNAIAEVERAWGVAQTNFNRRLAARQHLAAVESAFEADKADLDMVLEAQRRTSEADTRYFATLAEYALAIKNVHFEKGSLLDHDEVYLAEGPWPGKAYEDAEKLDWRTRPIWPLNYIFKKGPVVSAGPLPQQANPVDSSMPEALPLPAPDAAPVPEALPPAEISAGDATSYQTVTDENLRPASVTVSSARSNVQSPVTRVIIRHLRSA